MLWLTFLKAFVVGGAICLIGQIIINWTHLTNGKILGYALVKGAVEAAKTDGVVGAFTGGLAACATGVSVAIFFGYLVALIFKPRTKTF